MPVKNSHIHQFFVNGLQGSIWNNKAFHLIAHTNQKMYTISSIWHKNMHQHLFVTIIIWCETLTIFWEESSRKTQSYKEQFHLAYCHAKKCTQYQYIQKMYTISSIWHKNMHQHLFVTIIIWCETLTIFWEESSRKTQSYKEQFHLAYCHAKWRLLCLLSFKYFWNTWQKCLWTADYPVFCNNS